MYNYLYDTNQCVLNHCHKEQQKASKKHQEYISQLSKLLLLFSKKKISESEFNKKTKYYNNKITKNKHKIDFLDCQIKNCYKIVHDQVIKTIKEVKDVMMKDNDYNAEDYNKYLNHFKKNKVTSQKIIEYEIEAKKRSRKLIRNYYKK